VRQVLRSLPSARFVLKTDVASYYASIDHVKLLDRVAAVIPDRTVLNLVGQMCGRVSEGGGLYFEHRRGIPLSCPLSPLLGAFFLNELDERLQATGLFFGLDNQTPVAEGIGIGRDATRFSGKIRKVTVEVKEVK